jgi:hypothetical protein
MKVGAQYGLLLGILFVVLDRLNSPIAWATYWATHAILLTIYTKVAWQRTGLFWVAVSGADAALFCAAFVPASLAGYTLRNLPSPWSTIFWFDMAALVLTELLCWVLYREEFRRWARHMDAMSLRDMLMYRHIPHLR